jgi:hypothetical protein
MSRPDPRKSRGYRNRNPGNIEHSPANKWLGLDDPPSDGRFCRFVSHEHGIRALAVLLQAYQDRHGLRTVRAIINRFAPGHENPTEAYVTAVARRMGVGRDAAIDVHDPATMRALVEAIIAVELGGQPYDDATLTEGLRMAGLVQPGLAHSGTAKAAAGTAAAAIGTTAVLEAAAAIAPHAEGIATILRALGPWTVACVVAAVAAWFLWHRWRQQKRVAGPIAASRDPSPVL